MGGIGYGGYAPAYGIPAATYPAGAKGLVTHPNGAVVPAEPIGVVVGKIDEDDVFIQQQQQQPEGGGTNNTNDNVGYIGMLAVSENYRRRGIGKALVKRVVQRMKDMGCTSVTLETEVSNVTAQKLYQDGFGFVREEKLIRYY